MSSRELLRKYGYVLGLLALTLTIGIGWFLLDGRVGFNFADEGYLWYGSEALCRGEVPMRDFEAYDPGRYVWTAACSFFLGHTIVALRLSCVLFQCLGVMAGLLTMRRVSRNWLFLSAITLLLSVWMHPRYKVFEQSIALMAVYAGVLLLEKPSLRRHFVVGVFGGLSAFFGRNHGAYHLLAFSLLITVGARSSGWLIWMKRCLVWSAGLFTGYLPQLLMFLFVPGFFRTFLVYVTSIFAHGTNLAKPVTWPWLVSMQAPTWMRISSLAQGCFYVALIAFLVVAAVRLLFLRREKTSSQRLLLAAACVSLAYIHFTFSRPDIVHLSHAAPVMLVGLLALAFTFLRPGRLIAYALLPLFIVGSLAAEMSQVGIAFKYLAPPGVACALRVNGEPMLVGSSQALTLASAHQLVQDLAKPDEAIFFAPHTPGLYTFTGRHSPTTQLYFVFPATREADKHLVDQLEAAKVQWAMIENYELDGRDDLRFCNTNPLVWDYLRRNFNSVPLATLPSDTVLLHRRPSPDS